MLYFKSVSILLCFITLSYASISQIVKAPLQEDSTIYTISEKALHLIERKYMGLNDDISKQTYKLLGHMQSKEEKLKQKLSVRDSVKAKLLFTNSAEKYRQLKYRIQLPPGSNIVTHFREYIPQLDSLETAMHFFSTKSLISSEKLEQIRQISSQLQKLQKRLQDAKDAQTFIQQREQQLKSQLGQVAGLQRQLLSINKEVFYFQGKLAQYRATIGDKEKLEETVLIKLRELPAFKNFMQKNSMLAQIFPTGLDASTPSTVVAGLQTRAQIQSILSTRIPSLTPGTSGTANGTDPTQYMQREIEQAQSQLSSLKDRLNQLGLDAGGSTSVTMPDFKPNSQHNKSFFKRLEFGFNFQTTSSTSLLPATCNIGLNAGYKLSDKATVGTGISYLLGLGNGFSRIAFTNQGIGLRSYFDIKAKGMVWFTGGYEYNYMKQFAKFTDINKLNVWQKSVLVGMKIKYKLAKKEGNLQVLYDLMAEKEIPNRRPLIFRIGYVF